MIIDEPTLRQLVHVFLAENAKLNLSAFRTEEHCWIGNVLDSVALLNATEKIPALKDTKRLIDIGTGGGFPLLPLAISLPAVTCIGIDSTKKKMDALGRIKTALQLKNVELRSGRIEELAHTAALRGSADLVTARALAPLSVLLEYAVPLLKVGGLCAFWKSSKIAAELADSATAQKLLHSPYAGMHEYELPSPEWGKRLILFFVKKAGTPAEYPRGVGIPTGKPL